MATRLDAAVTEALGDTNVGLRCVVSNHTLITVGCDLREEAHYICALLNSSPSRFLVQNCIVIHPDTHVLENVRIPRCDLTNPAHCQLSVLSQQAHVFTNAARTISR